MQMLIVVLAAAFSMVLLSSWQATVLIGVVLSVQLTMNRVLTPRVRYLLWGIVLARLLIPVFPESSFSVFSVSVLSDALPSPTLTIVEEPKETSQVSVVVETSATASARFSSNRIESARKTLAELRSTTQSDLPLHSSFGDTADVAGESTGQIIIVRSVALVWSVGVLVFLVRILRARSALAGLLSNACEITDPEILRLLHNCQKTAGVSRSVNLMQVDESVSPAVVGVLRPTILLPASVVESFSQDELRHVLLHELGHVKHYDLAFHWLCEALQIIHWFNPVIWFGLRRLRFDRELACDAFVLECSGQYEAKAYGNTTIKLLELMTFSRAVPASVGILDRKPAVFRRIKMIGSFQQPSRLRWVVSALVLAMTAAIGLTNAAPPGDEVNAGVDAVSEPITNSEQPLDETSGDDVSATVAEGGSDHRVRMQRLRADLEKSHAGVKVKIQVLSDDTLLLSGFVPSPEQVNEIVAVAEKVYPRIVNRLQVGAVESTSRSAEEIPKRTEPEGTNADNAATAHVKLTADSEGKLNSVRFNGKVIPNDVDVFEQLGQRMREWADAPGRPPLAKRELEIDADYQLDYDMISKTIGACTGRKNPTTKQLERFVERVKFAPPRKQTLELTVGYLRDSKGRRLSKRPVIMLGDNVIQLDAAEAAFREWLKMHSMEANQVGVRIRSDQEVSGDTIQQLVKIAQEMRFEEFAMHVLRPVDDDAQQVSVIVLKYIAAAEAAEVLQRVFEDSGPAIVADEKTNSVVVTANDKNMHEVKKILEQLDNDISHIRKVQFVRVFQLKQLDAAEAARTLTAIFPNSKDGGPRIEADVLANRLVVQCDEATMGLIERLLIQLGEKADRTPSSPPPAPVPKAPAAEPTSFMDIEGSGRSVVYVIDNSASMQSAQRFELAKQQLKSSVRRLTPEQTFQILFYNDSVTHIRLRKRPAERMYSATPANIELASAEIDREQPEGGTSPLPPLLQALSLRPDVIYFLTDGDQPALSSAELANLKTQNKSDAKVHVIEFTAEQPASRDPSWPSLLASQSAGEYRAIRKQEFATHVSVSPSSQNTDFSNFFSISIAR